MANKVKRYWVDAPGNDQLAWEIATEAAANPPQTLVLATRASMIARRHESQMSAAWRDRLNDLYEDVERLIEDHHVVDSLGNPNTDPVIALFESFPDLDVNLKDADLQRLRSVRLGSASRGLAAKHLLSALGPDALPPDLTLRLERAALEQAERASEFQAEGLFATGDCGLVLGLRVNTSVSRTSIRSLAESGQRMEKQVTFVLEKILNGGGADWELEWLAEVDGESIGLSSLVAGLVATGRLPSDPLLGATGTMDVSGRIRGVGAIAQKLTAARDMGLRRVLLPEENRGEAGNVEGLDTVFVDRWESVPTMLVGGAWTATKLGYEGRLRAIRSAGGLYGLEIVDERPLANGYEFTLTDGMSKANINVYTGSKGSIHVGGPEGTAKLASQKLLDEWLPRQDTQGRSQRRFTVPKGSRSQRLRELCQDAAIPETPKNNEEFRYRFAGSGSTATLVLYSSGTCVVLPGTAPAWDQAEAVVLKALDGLAVKNTDRDDGGGARISAEELSLRRAAHVGTDEAGKGDFFGPLVSAAVYVDAAIIDRLASLGVKDSKLLGDRAVLRLATEIRRAVPRYSKITRIGPSKFNELYREMKAEGKNLNTLLAWGHTRSLENLLLKGCEPEYVIVDRFADRRYIASKLGPDTRRRQLEIIEVPKAEADIAVAAASILARADFLTWMSQTSAKLGIDLPKGASDKVVETGRMIVARFGADRLESLAKMSFRTAERVLNP